MPNSSLFTLASGVLGLALVNLMDSMLNDDAIMWDIMASFSQVDWGLLSLFFSSHKGASSLDKNVDDKKNKNNIFSSTSKQTFLRKAKIIHEILSTLCLNFSIVTANKFCYCLVAASFTVAGKRLLGVGMKSDIGLKDDYTINSNKTLNFLRFVLKQNLAHLLLGGSFWATHYRVYQYFVVARFPVLYALEFLARYLMPKFIRENFSFYGSREKFSASEIEEVFFTDSETGEVISHSPLFSELENVLLILPEEEVANYNAIPVDVCKLKSLTISKENPEGIFFSSAGDPLIFDTDNNCLRAQHPEGETEVANAASVSSLKFIPVISDYISVFKKTARLFQSSLINTKQFFNSGDDMSWKKNTFLNRIRLVSPPHQVLWFMLKLNLVHYTTDLASTSFFCIYSCVSTFIRNVKKEHTFLFNFNSYLYPRGSEDDMADTEPTTGVWQAIKKCQRSIYIARRFVYNTFSIGLQGLRHIIKRDATTFTGKLTMCSLSLLAKTTGSYAILILFSAIRRFHYSTLVDAIETGFQSSSSQLPSRDIEMINSQVNTSITVTPGSDTDVSYGLVAFYGQAIVALVTCRVAKVVALLVMMKVGAAFDALLPHTDEDHRREWQESEAEREQEKGRYRHHFNMSAQTEYKKQVRQEGGNDSLPEEMLYQGIDYYHILGICQNDSEKTIKKQYRDLAVKYHPDKVWGEEKKRLCEEQFKKINEAYHVLSDPEKRRLYDVEREQAGYYQFMNAIIYWSVENLFKFFPSNWKQGMLTKTLKRNNIANFIRNIVAAGFLMYGTGLLSGALTYILIFELLKMSTGQGYIDI